MAVISGTFADTGQSATVAAPIITIQMNFASTGSVNVESQMPGGDWIVIETVTADYHQVVEQGGAVPIRLNCTDATGNVDYALTTK